EIQLQNKHAYAPAQDRRDDVCGERRDSAYGDLRLGYASDGDPNRGRLAADDLNLLDFEGVSPRKH
ncbi:MAG: hypothetical protein WCC77_04675, partial [Pseudolabrys sp.]